MNIYNFLRRIPNATEEEVQQVANLLAKANTAVSEDYLQGTLQHFSTKAEAKNDVSLLNAQINELNSRLESESKPPKKGLFDDPITLMAFILYGIALIFFIVTTIISTQNLG